MPYKESEGAMSSHFQRFWVAVWFAVRSYTFVAAVLLTLICLKLLSSLGPSSLLLIWFGVPGLLYVRTIIRGLIKWCFPDIPLYFCIERRAISRRFRWFIDVSDYGDDVSYKEVWKLLAEIYSRALPVAIFLAVFLTAFGVRGCLREDNQRIAENLRKPPYAEPYFRLDYDSGKVRVDTCTVIKGPYLVAETGLYLVGVRRIDRDRDEDVVFVPAFSASIEQGDTVGVLTFAYREDLSWDRLKYADFAVPLQ